MSHPLISRNPDLQKLADEGLALEVRGNFLIVHYIPYVNSRTNVEYGTLVSELNFRGEELIPPESHVARFIGEHPCDKQGSILETIKHSSDRQEILPANPEARIDALIVDHMFSCLPLHTRKYPDYHSKISTYVAMISGPAEALGAVHAHKGTEIHSHVEESVFKYRDTASSRAAIDPTNAKLALLKRIAIVGVGGTGSYVLDLVSKTPVKEIHLYDGDKFSNHNAFRAPGAATLDEVTREPVKSEYFREKYSAMRINIFANGYVDENNLNELADMDFVFICVDKGTIKRQIVELLESRNVPFVDVGMGLHVANNSIFGALSVTTSSHAKRDHVWNKKRIHFSDGDEGNEYSRNIQIADLNALNAALAVIRWKKLFGFYKDFDEEHYMTYTVDGNMLLNDDQV